MRWLPSISISAALAACGHHEAPAPAPPDPNAWLAPCETALAKAEKEPSWRRGRTIVDGCRPCGVPWDDAIALTTPAPSKVVAVVDACKLACPTNARSDFYAAISALEMDQPAHEAWLALGKACPAALGHPGADGRYASGAWFALHQIGRALAAVHKTPTGIAIAMPLWSQIGTGYVLPATRAPLVDVQDMMIVTANAADQQFALPGEQVARFGPAGLGVDDSGEWPGEPLSPRGALPNTLVVPIAMPVARLREIVETDDKLAAIAVAPPPGETLFGGEIAGIAVPTPRPAGWPPATGTVADAVKALGATPP